jgi:hypothetical protein
MNQENVLDCAGCQNLSNLTHQGTREIKRRKIEQQYKERIRINEIWRDFEVVYYEG